MFEGIRNWLEVRAAVKDARRVKTAKSTLNLILIEDKLKHANEMVSVDQLDYAAEVADELLARYPDDIIELPETVHLLLRLLRLDDAEAVAVRGMQRNPDNRDFFRFYCDIADMRGDTPERLRRWRSFRRRYPAFSLSFRMEAQALLAAGEDAAAEQVLAEGTRVAVDDEVFMFFEYARRAEARRDWPAAIERWRIVRDRFEHSAGCAQIAAALSELARYDEAEAELLAGQRRFPFAPQITEDLAGLAQRRGDVEAALEHWAALRANAPTIGRAYTEPALLLRARGDAAAADALIAEGVTRVRVPTDKGLHVEFAGIAERAGDLAETARRWQQVRELFPNDPHGYHAGAIALQRAGQPDAAEQVLVGALERFPKNVDLHQQFAGLAEARGDLVLAAERLRGAVAAEPGSSSLHSALAQALERSGASAEADAALAAAIKLRPDDPALYVEHAAMATRAGRPEVAAARLAEAEGALQAAWTAQPRDFGIAAGWARLASAAADWPEAQRRWALVAERFPAEGHPVWQQAIALREAGRLAEAESLLRAGVARYQGDPSFAHDLARLAEARGDHAEAELCWRRYTVLEPKTWWSWTALATALQAQRRLDEAEAALRQGDEACPGVSAFLRLGADWALQRQDWPDAERRARLLTARFPQAWEGPWVQARALREQGRLDDAWTILLRGAEQHPRDRVFAHDLASVAMARADWSAAEHWWRRYLEADDSESWAHGELAHTLDMQGRGEEGDALLLAAVHRHTDELAFHRQYASSASRRGDPGLAQQRWEAVVDRFPHDPESLRSLAGAYAENHQTQRAIQLLEQGLERLPHDRSLARALLELALDRGDDAAKARWRSYLIETLHPALEHGPDNPDLLVETFETLKDLPQADWPVPARRLEGWMQAAIERGDTNVLLHGSYAAMAAARGEWAEQHCRLEASVRRFPNDGFLRTRLSASREIMAVHGEDGASASQAVAGSAPPDRDAALADLPPADLVLRFESLGGGGASEGGWGFGCEFGYFQREFGQEPLSLLRWASIGPENLIRALNEDFAGFGDPAAIQVDDAAGGEDWSVDDTVYQSRFDHTHLSRAGVPRQEAQRLVAMRVKFLARKLVGDLQAGEKVFVYRVIDRALDRSTILRLAGAVNRFGNNVLLFVAPADDGHPAFHVEHVHPGLMIGYIDFFRAGRGQFREWNHAGWLRLCREALRVWQANAPETTERPASLQKQGAEDEDLASTVSTQTAHPPDFHAACAWAREAADAGDWPEARRRWALLRAGFPAEGHPAWQEAVALREAGEAEAARELLLQGAARYAADPSFAHDLARMAESRGDWPEAARWWRHFVALLPQMWWGHTGLANALREQGDTAAAEAVLLAAHAALPDDPPILLDYARLAGRRRDWPEAERRFAHVVERFPTRWEGVAGQAGAMREAGRLTEAEALLRQAAERHPDVAPLHHDLARLSSQRQDWTQAERDWRRYLAIDPHPWWAHSELARARLAQGERADAVAMLGALYGGSGPFDPWGMADAIELLGSILEPSVLPLIEQLEGQLAPHVDAAEAAQIGFSHANAARYLERFEVYRTRVEALAARFPAEQFVRIALHDARELAPHEGDLDDDGSLPAPAAAGRDTAADTFDDQDLLRFESLGGGGDRGGCEFGLLQRAVGEPLSLLRWASIEPEQLADALERRFEGLGNPDTLLIQPQGHYDWKAVETVYDIRMDHTHLDRQTVSRESAARQVVTRLKFLSRKLVNDLVEADKIFLYRFAGGIVPDATLLRLSRAVASYGAARLVVTCEDPAPPPWHIDYREVAPNLLLAVRPNTVAIDGQDLEPRLPGWRQICLHARRWRQGTFQTPARLPYPDEAPRDAAAWMDGETRIPRNLHAASDWAGQAVAAADWPEARRRWAKLRGLFPADGLPAWQEAVALRESGAPEAARALLVAGAARYPRDSSFSRDLARLAEAEGDWPEAERWWRAFVVLHPDLWWAYSGLVQALVRQDRTPDAEAALLAAAETLPGEPVIALEYARLAEQRRDWPEAERRYQEMAARFPQRGESLWGLAALARARGSAEEAEQLLREGADRFPAMTSFAHDLARLAEERRDWPEAERRWRQFLAHEAGMWWAHTALASALHAQGRLAEADAVWQAAEAAFPGEPALLAEPAQVAANDGNWALALRLWTRLADRFPDDPRGHVEAAFALRMLDRAAEALAESRLD